MKLDADEKAVLECASRSALWYESSVGRIQYVRVMPQAIE